jgi:hypothetical protein
MGESLCCCSLVQVHVAVSLQDLLLAEFADQAFWYARVAQVRGEHVWGGVSCVTGSC